MAGMDENPFKTPTDGLSAKRAWPWLAIGLGCGAAGLFAFAVLAIVAFLTAPYVINVRENPRRQDAVHAREKTEKAAQRTEN